MSLNKIQGTVTHRKIEIKLLLIHGYLDMKNLQGPTHFNLHPAGEAE